MEIITSTLVLQSYSVAANPVTTAEAIRHLRLPGMVDNVSGDKTQGADFTNTTNPLTITAAVTNYPLISFASGLLIDIGSEFMEVTTVSGNDVTFARGVLETQVASHADGVQVSTSNDNELSILQLIDTARIKVQVDSTRQLMKATYKAFLDEFPGVAEVGSASLENSLIELRIPPVVSVESVKHVDSDGVTLTVDAAKYLLDKDSEPGRLRPAHGQSWPDTRVQTNTVTIDFTAGYADIASVPANAKHAIKLLVHDWYWNRGPVGQVGTRVLDSFESLIHSLRWTY